MDERNLDLIGKSRTAPLRVKGFDRIRDGGRRRIGLAAISQEFMSLPFEKITEEI